MEFQHTHVYNELQAIQGARYSYKSDSKSDSMPQRDGTVKIGPRDAELIERLVREGPSQRKFMRQILVSVDIIAPRYWWIEFDTYKVGTVSMSESTMHTLMKKPLEMEDFEFVKPETQTLLSLNQIWHQGDFNRLISLLPQSYKQKRLVTLNYEVIKNIIDQRRGHKLRQWGEFIDWATTLDNASLFFGGIDERGNKEGR